MTDKELYAQYHKSAPKLDIAFLVQLHPQVLAIPEAAALAAKDKPTKADAARVACVWRSLTPYCRVNMEAEFWAHWDLPGQQQRNPAIKGEGEVPSVSIL